MDYKRARGLTDYVFICVHSEAAEAQRLAATEVNVWFLVL